MKVKAKAYRQDLVDLILQFGLYSDDFRFEEAARKLGIATRHARATRERVIRMALDPRERIAAQDEKRMADALRAKVRSERR